MSPKPVPLTDAYLKRATVVPAGRSDQHFLRTSLSCAAMSNASGVVPSPGTEPEMSFFSLDSAAGDALPTDALEAPGVSKKKKKKVSYIFPLASLPVGHAKGFCRVRSNPGASKATWQGATFDLSKVEHRMACATALQWMCRAPSAPQAVNREGRCVNECCADIFGCPGLSASRPDGAG